MQKLILKINLLLTSKRLQYPWFIGGALWLGWIISLIGGKGNTDLAGHLIGTDFVAFYTAGKIILMDRSPDLYNLELAHNIQQSLYGGASLNFNPYLNPPHYALLMVPFALIPYPWAPILWIALGLICLWVSLRWLGARNPLRTFFFSLTWLPVFYAASFGQNSFISLAILALTYLFWIRNRQVSAGLTYSLLLFKPQLLIGISFLWLIEWKRNWKCLAGMGFGTLIQLALNFFWLPEASRAYLAYALNVNSNLMSIEGFPMWNAFSLQAFWMALLPGFKSLAQFLYLLSAGLSSYYFFRFVKQNSSHPALIFSAAIAWLVWVIPYIMIYDWTLLIVPGILLWENAAKFRQQWRAMFATLWVLTFLSSVITFLMLRTLPFAIQISVPTLLIVLTIAYQSLMTPKTITQAVDSR